MIPPNNLSKMVSFINLRNKMEFESHSKKEEINSISDNILILGKVYLQHLFKFNMSLWFMYSHS